MRTAEDLQRTFASLDHVFFDDHCAHAGVTVRWKRFRPAKHSFTYGRYLMNPPEIRINVRLAQLDVPQYVVSSVLLHEMLHFTMGLDHDVAFQQAEARYPFFWDSERWCSEFLKREFPA